jgi:hypothetical protein
MKHLHKNNCQYQSSLGKTQHAVATMWRKEGQLNEYKCGERNIRGREGNKGTGIEEWG